MTVLCVEPIKLVHGLSVTYGRLELTSPSYQLRYRPYGQTTVKKALFGKKGGRSKKGQPALKKKKPIRFPLNELEELCIHRGKTSLRYGLFTFKGMGKRYSIQFTPAVREEMDELYLFLIRQVNEKNKKKSRKKRIRK